MSSDFFSYKFLKWHVSSLQKIFWKEVRSEHVEMKLLSCDFKFYFALNFENKTRKLKIIVRNLSIFAIKNIQANCVVKVKDEVAHLIFPTTEFNWQFSKNDFEATLLDLEILQSYSEDFNMTLDIEIKLIASEAELCDPNMLTFPVDDVDQKISFDVTYDYTFVCSDEVEVPVDKEVLSKISQVFADMIKRKQNKTKIVDIDSMTMNQVIDFVISGGSGANWSVEMASKLLYVAEKYEIIKLKCESHNFLLKNIDFNNVFEILEVADFYNLKRLEGKCLTFIVMHYEKLKKSRDWKKITNLDLTVITKIMDSLINFTSVTTLDTIKN